MAIIRIKKLTCSGNSETFSTWHLSRNEDGNIVSSQSKTITFVESTDGNDDESLYTIVNSSQQKTKKITVRDNEAAHRRSLDVAPFESEVRII